MINPMNQAGAPQAPQVNLSPSTMPTVQQQLAAYRELYAQQKAEVQEQVDPFEPQYDKEDPQAQQQQLDDWLTPVSSDVSTSEVSPNDNERYNRFIDMFDNSPVVAEHGEQMQEVLEQLRQGIQAGQISYDQAMSIATDLLDKHVAPSMDKHYGTNFTTKNIINPNVKDVASAFGSEVEDRPDGRGVQSTKEAQ